jgi:hypothetical protein
LHAAIQPRLLKPVSMSPARVPGLAVIDEIDITELHSRRGEECELRPDET